MKASLFLLLCANLYAQQASIQGIAVDSVTHQPMAGVHITLRALGASIYGAITRPDGHFSITGLNPTVYFIQARYNGYLQVPAKSSTVFENTQITLKAGEELKDVKVELTPHAVITGHVLDENGDPVRYVQVTAQSAESNQPQRYEGNTDERGQFRIALPPGKFYVQAHRFGFERTIGPPEIRSDGYVPPDYANTFYPATTNKDKAELIELTPGQLTTGIDIHLVSGRSVTISGTVTGMPNDPSQQGSQAFISLFPVTTDGDSSQQNTFAGPDGKFTIHGVAPGQYRLFARLQSMDGTTLQSPPLELTVGSAAETNLTLALAHGETLSGTVEIEGAAKSAPAEKLTVHLQSESDQSRSPGGPVADDGTFQVDQVFAGKFHIQVMPMPENAYIKSVKLGGVESDDGTVDLSGGVAGAQIAITLSRNGGQVEGSIVGEDGKPSTIPLAFVILAANAEQLDESNLKSLQAGDKFKFTGLRPGKYWLLAVDPQQFIGGRSSPEALKALLARGLEIEIHENDRITKDVKPLTPEGASAKKQ